MNTFRDLAVGVVILLIIKEGVSASSGFTKIMDDLRPMYCDATKDASSCADVSTDPGTLVVNTLYRLAGQPLPGRVKAWNQRASDEPVMSTLDCDFQPATMPGLPIPFLCDWDMENNDDANWEPGGTLFNGLSDEEGPPGGLFEVYAIARLNSPTTTSTTSLMAPMVDGRTDDVIVALLDFQYFLHCDEPEDCKLSVKLLRKDGARTQIWSTKGHFSDGAWQDSGRLQFSPPVPFQLVFESTLSPGINASYVAVNDVKFSTGVLLSEYNCEEGSIFPESCGLIDLDGRLSYWTGQNASDNNKGPLTDHTLDNQSGHFIINRNPIWYEFARERAHLQTPNYYKWTNQSTCTFRFYYHAKNAVLGDMKIAVSADSGNQDYTIDLDGTERWVEHTVDLTEISGNYRVTFDVLTASTNNHIAIDDIGFLEDECKGRRFCSSFPCMNGGTCSQSSQEDFHCTCAEGYEGPDCSINIDECSLDASLCANDDTRICQNASPGYKCVCRPNLMEYNGRCIASCLDNPCSREYEVCLQNDNGFSCQCQYGYIDSEDGQCIRDKTDVEHGLTSYEQTVILGSYLSGGFLAIMTALLVVTCYFSCCDEAVEDDKEPDQVESENYYEELGVSESNANGTAPGMSAQNGGFEMEDRNSLKK